MTQSSEGDLPRQLVLDAFRLAHAKRGATQMQLGVLKNRILQSSSNGFDEGDFGFPSFRALVESLDDIVTFVPATHPPVVELTPLGISQLVSDGPVEATPDYSGQRLRQDLWNALMDYSSGVRYVWDSQARQAVAQTDDRPAGPQMPTLSEQDLRLWRESFLASIDLSEFEAETDTLTSWTAGRQPTAHLPRRLRHQWNASLKHRAADLLRSWAATTAVRLPDNLFVETMPDRSDEARDLRAFVHACIDAMSADDLRGLLIPARVAQAVRA